MFRASEYNLSYQIRSIPVQSPHSPWYFLARIRVRISIMVVQQLKAENRAMRANLRNRLIDAWIAQNGRVELKSSRGHAHACPRPVSWPLRPLRPIYGDIYLFRTFARTILLPAPLHTHHKNCISPCISLYKEFRESEYNLSHQIRSVLDRAPYSPWYFFGHNLGQDISSLSRAA